MIYSLSLSLSNILFIIQLTIERMMLKTIAAPKPLTLKLLLRILEQSNTIIPFITKENNPNVIMFMGSDRNFIIGFMIVFMIPRTIATMAATHHGVMSTLLIRLAVIRIAADERISFAIITRSIINCHFTADVSLQVFFDLFCRHAFPKKVHHLGDGRLAGDVVSADYSGFCQRVASVIEVAVD